jgi:MFS family permease
MVASNRLASEGRGRTLGAVAAAIMAGVAVGSPLGGWLVTHAGPRATYLVGAGVLLLAAAVTGALGPVRRASSSTRYAWRRDTLTHWVPLGYAFLDRFTIGIFVSTFTLYLANVVGLSAQQRGFMVTLFVLPFAVLCYPVGRLADRTGWFAPMLTGNLLFGLTFASYGLVPAEALPIVMVASGVFSALMFAPNLLLVSDLARLGAGEGLFGAFQVAGSFGFLLGPVAGGILVGVTRGADGGPAYREIFIGVGGLAFGMAAFCFGACRRLARQLADARRHASLAAPAPDRAV